MKELQQTGTDQLGLSQCGNVVSARNELYLNAGHEAPGGLACCPGRIDLLLLPQKQQGRRFDLR